MIVTYSKFGYLSLLHKIQPTTRLSNQPFDIEIRIWKISGINSNIL